MNFRAWIVVVFLTVVAAVGALSIRHATAAPLTVVESVDLSITTLNPPFAVHYNDQLALNYRVVNAGPSAAREVTVAIIVPAEFRVKLPILTSPSPWKCSVLDTERVVPKIVCSLATLNPGASADLSFAFQVNYAPYGTAIHTRAWVGSAIQDVNWSNDIHDQLSMMQ